MNPILFILCSLLLSFPLVGQDTLTSKRASCNYQYNNFYDATFSIGKQQIAGAIGYSHLHGFGKKKQKFKIGYGVRFTSYYGYSAGKFYTTAPSNLTSPVQGPTTIFSETLEENIDTVAFSNPQVNSLNLSIHLQYSFSKKLDLGFNIDAVGFSFGSKQNASVISSVYDNGQNYLQTASPTKFNLLLTSDNDIGSLNSEFYLRYWLTPKLGIRAGYMFYFSEYQLERPITFDNGRISNDRYRLKSSLLLVGISYTPFTK